VGDRGVGRPVDIRGRERKEALVHAWESAQWLDAKLIASRAGRMPMRTLYAILHAERPNLPTHKMLTIVAGLFREQARRLTAQADQLEAVSERTEG